MNRNLIMSEGNLEEILTRLSCALDLFYLIHSRLDESDVEASMCGACDLLRSIIKDFRADVESAEAAG